MLKAFDDLTRLIDQIIPFVKAGSNREVREKLTQLQKAKLLCSQKIAMLESELESIQKINLSSN